VQNDLDAGIFFVEKDRVELALIDHDRQALFFQRLGRGHGQRLAERTDRTGEYAGGCQQCSCHVSQHHRLLFFYF